MRSKDSKEFEALYLKELEADPDISKKTAYHRAEEKYFADNGRYKYQTRQGYYTFKVMMSRRRCNSRRATP